MDRRGDAQQQRQHRQSIEQPSAEAFHRNIVPSLNR
jgi:hypothetical protein